MSFKFILKNVTSELRFPWKTHHRR